MGTHFNTEEKVKVHWETPDAETAGTEQKGVEARDRSLIWHFLFPRCCVEHFGYVSCVGPERFLYVLDVTFVDLSPHQGSLSL